MSKKLSFSESVRGKNVLFINSIRLDVKSGGGTSTSQLLNYASSVSNLDVCNLYELTGTLREAINVVLAMPGAVAILLNRLTRITLFEFFSRLSAMEIFKLLFIKFDRDIDLIVLNHHSSFIYGILFSNKFRVYVWHDLPSTKVVSSKILGAKANSVLTQFVENFFLHEKNSNHFVFSCDDKKFLSRYYNIQAELLPVGNFDIATCAIDITPNHWLLVGNWTRQENIGGAEVFFSSYMSQMSNKDNLDTQFCIAGNAADTFFKNLQKKVVIDKRIKFKIVPYYKSLDEFIGYTLVAPLIEGAGIKLKTLESWANGIPVIGTRQAVSGIPTENWKFGALIFNSPDKIAAFCHGGSKSLQLLKQLNPIIAYTKYSKTVTY